MDIIDFNAYFFFLLSSKEMPNMVLINTSLCLPPRKVMQNSFCSQNLIDLPVYFILNSNFSVGKSAWGPGGELASSRKSIRAADKKASLIPDAGVKMHRYGSE